VTKNKSKDLREEAARAMFRADDLGGHIRGPWTWETIPEVGRANFRSAVDAVLSVVLVPLDDALMKVSRGDLNFADFADVMSDLLTAARPHGETS